MALFVLVVVIVVVVAFWLRSLFQDNPSLTLGGRQLDVSMIKQGVLADLHTRALLGPLLKMLVKFCHDVVYFGHKIQRVVTSMIKVDKSNDTKANMAFHAMHCTVLI